MTVRIVLDTNILVSGLFSSRGAPARIVDALNDGLFACYICQSFRLCYISVWIKK